MYNYLPWPSNMRTADHVLAMRIQEGAAGYGIYVMLLELLRDSETRSLVNNPKNLAFAINEPDTDLVARVITDYGLFEIAPDGAFRSPWLQQQLEEYDAKKEAAREAGKKGAAKRYGQKYETDKGTDSNPIATLYRTPLAPYSNNTNNINETKSTQSTSKLLGASWNEMTGQDLLELARIIQPPLDDITKGWVTNKQKELDEQRGVGKHNVECVYDIARYYKLGDAMFGWLLRYTDIGKVGSPELVKLIEIWNKNKADKFMPKYPSEYLLCKLLGV